MNGAFPDSLLEEIRLRTDIVQVVGDYVPLTRKGKNHVGLCPFHTDSKPSFSVNGEQQFFYCFGCGAGGDVFRFLMLRENLGFQEAVRELARRAGVALPESGAPGARDLRVERCRGLCEAAAGFFRAALREGGPGAAARRYLAGRGLDAATLDKFQIGLAPPGWQALVTYLKGRGHAPGDIVAAGLAGEKQGRVYDYFRNRIMFPVWDPQGRVVGFGGRVLDDDGPKYLNSPETACFNKRQLLYGLHLARQAVRELGYLVLMEGYVDVVSAHRHGVTNAVASLGTSLTVEQARLIARHTDQVVLAYDADAAGQAAAERSLSVLREAKVRVRVLTLEEGKDPDEYLRARGPEGWREMVDRARSPVAFKLDRALAARGAGDKAAVVREVLPVLAEIASAVEKEEAVRFVAQSMGLGWEVVREELQGFERGRKKWSNSDKIAKNRYNIIKTPANGPEQAGRRAQKAVLRILLLTPALIPVVRARLGDDFIDDPVLAEVFGLMVQYNTCETLTPAALMPKLPEEGQRAVSRLLMEEGPDAAAPALLEEYIAAIRRIAGRKKRDTLLMEMARAERDGDQVLLEQLMEQYKRLIDDGQGGV